jgi:LPXTG-site transpeptidase (sortase) family protein
MFYRLAYIPLSATSTGLAPNDMDNIYNPTTSTLTFEWDVFPLAATSTITFQATFVGPSPVANEASLEWTSIEIDPQLDGSPEQRSPYNIHSTERWYDPLDQTINDYRASDSVRIQTPDNNLPLTGFKLGESTVLPLQPEAKTYTDLGKMWLEIPKLKLKMPITGVPYVKNDWDLTWLSDQAGYLEGSTFPGQVGNTAITAHVVLADGTPGPFQSIDKLLWGDQIILHINGEKFIYELRQSINVLPSDYSLFRYDGYSWVTLITCDEYNKTTDTYLKRTLVKAVLVKTEVE